MLPEIKELLLRWDHRHANESWVCGKQRKREFSRFLMLWVRIIIPLSLQRAGTAKTIGSVVVD